MCIRDSPGGQGHGQHPRAGAQLPGQGELPQEGAAASYRAEEIMNIHFQHIPLTQMRSSIVHPVSYTHLDRVRKQMAAVYTAITEQQIIYSTIPASFEEYGQRIRLTDSRCV